MYRLFVSYSHVDRALVRKLIELLMVAEERTFIDAKDISPGQRWRVVITRAIARCEKMLVFWCCHSSTSDIVRHEYTQALQADKRIVPVLLDGSELPAELREFQWVDLRDVIGAHGDFKPAAGASRSDERGPGRSSSGPGDLTAFLPDEPCLEVAASRLQAALHAAATT